MTAMVIFKFFTGRTTLRECDYDFLNQIETMLGYMTASETVRYIAKNYEFQ